MIQVIYFGFPSCMSYYLSRLRLIVNESANLVIFLLQIWHCLNEILDLCHQFCVVVQQVDGVDISERQQNQLDSIAKVCGHQSRFGLIEKHYRLAPFRFLLFLISNVLIISRVSKDSQICCLKYSPTSRVTRRVLIYPSCSYVLTSTNILVCLVDNQEGEFTFLYITV